MPELETIISQFTVCGVSVFSIVAFIIYAVKKIKETYKEIQGDTYNKELAEAYKKVEAKLDDVIRSNRDLVKENKEKDKRIAVLTDLLAHREGYSDEETNNL